MAEKTEISLAVPVYNEEKSLLELYGLIESSLSKTSKSYEIIIIDDGSTDGSLEVLKEIGKKDTKVKFLSLRRIFGKDRQHLNYWSKRDFAKIMSKHNASIINHFISFPWQIIHIQCSCDDD